MVIECRYTSLRKIQEGSSLASDFDTSDNVIDFRDSKCGMIQILRDGGDNNDGTFSLKVSLFCDPTTFIPYDPSGKSDIGGAECSDESLGWVFNDIPFRYAIVEYTKGTDTVGTASVWGMGKK